MPSFWENIRFADESEDVMVSQGMDMATYVSHPAPSEGSSFPAVIVVMEAFGVTRHIEQVCDEYAATAMSPSPPRSTTATRRISSWATTRCRRCSSTWARWMTAR